MPTIAPYGSWASPITADKLVERAVGLDGPVQDGPDVYWSESRPSEAGRQVVVRERAGVREDVLPPDYSARTLVHEYGGRCYAVRGGTVFFTNFADQRLYRVDPGGDPVPLTETDGGRFADPAISPDGTEILCVRERHTEAGVLNDLVAIAASGGPPHVVASGRDFYAAPRYSPDGARLAWITWDLPNMPWDGSELWESAGDAPRLRAGGQDESITQPRYSPSGVLHWISDRTGWWNLYADGEPLLPRAGEFAGPDWVFGNSTYTFLDDGTLVAAWSEGGALHLGTIAAGEVRDIPVPYTELDALHATPGGVLAVAASPTEAPAVVRIEVPSGEVTVVRRGRESVVDPAYISPPRPIEFPTEGGRTAHALFYAPANPDYRAPAGELAPLIVMSHGGPTGRTRGSLNYAVQFWTSRGIAVVDVDYGGSSGYGRDYRRRLDGAWGVADVDDCVNAARWLAAEGHADPNRLVIRGGSAGGYTTLCALTFRDAFAAGASHFGVADAGALARDTHKFESRYLDRLIGPWPEAEALYAERSPIFHTDRLNTPLILFQGAEDRVVPPNQAEMMAAALDAKGVPYAHIVYEGEQHGFRQAENIKRTAGLELAFFGRVLGFEPAGPPEPLEIVNAANL